MHRRTLLTLGAALLITAAACGNGDDTGPTDDVVEPVTQDADDTASPTPTPDEAQRAPEETEQPADPSDDATAEPVDAEIPEYVIDGGNREVYVTDITGEREQRLTESPAMNASPAWSPDGEHIAWVQIDDAGDEEAGLYVANADGSDPRLVTSPASPRGIDWHPDGDRIAFVSSHETDSGWDEVHTVNLDGGERQQVTFWEEIPTEHQYYGSTHPAWSPDGDRLAVVVDQLDDFEQIHVLDFSVDEPAIQLTDISDQRKRSPTWSPNGDRIAFHATPHEHPYPQIFLTEVATGETSLMTANEEIAFLGPNWSPDGDWVALSINEADGSQIAVMRPDGSERRKITDGSPGNTTPRWSPDGARLLFIAERDSQLAEPCSQDATVTLGPQQGLDELAWSSHVVVTGTVVEEHDPAWAEPQNVPMDTCLGIFTDYTVEVETQFRGEAFATVRLRLPGWRIGDHQQTYEPNLELSAGEQVLLFLSPDAERELLPDAWATSPQRAWKIVDGQLESAHLPGELEGITLADAEQVIRDALAGDPPDPQPRGLVHLDESPVTD